MTHTAVDAIAAALFLGALVILVVQTRQVRSRFGRELDRLERQNEIGRVLLTDRNVRGVTRHVAESAARLLGSDLAHVTLVTEHEHRLVVSCAPARWPRRSAPPCRSNTAWPAG